MLRLISARIWPLVTPLHEPIKMAFGVMRSRPSLLLQLVDESGAEGWGEAWVNFPHWAMAERTIVLHALLRAHITELSGPLAITAIRQRFTTEVVQSGSFGAFYHALSAIEIALWDLEAKKNQSPLRTLLSTPQKIVPSIPVYASGIGPNHITQRVEQAVKQGFTTAKIKVGFNVDHDHQNFRSVQAIDGIEVAMVDANQAWTVEEARKELAFYENAGAEWIEEPISAWDFDGYAQLSEEFTRIAAGENWYLEHRALSKSLRLRVLQPDLCKIGGIQAAAAFLDGNPIADWVAFHVLSGPIAQAAALQVATAWGDRVKWVEVDTNENDIREVVQPAWKIAQGSARLNQEPGLGIHVDTARLERCVSPELMPYHRVIYAD